MDSIFNIYAKSRILCSTSCDDFGTATAHDTHDTFIMQGLAPLLPIFLGTITITITITISIR